jgi:hypothetical protein
MDHVSGIFFLKAVVDRMKTLDKFLDIEVDNETLVLSVNTDLAVMKTYYREIKIRAMVNEETGMNSTVGVVRARVDIRKFSKLLQLDLIHPENMICCKFIMLFNYFFVNSNKKNLLRSHESGSLIIACNIRSKRRVTYSLLTTAGARK